MLSRDLRTILVGEQAVYEGIISSVGGIREAVQKLHELADGYRAGRMKKEKTAIVTRRKLSDILN